MILSDENGWFAWAAASRISAALDFGAGPLRQMVALRPSVQYIRHMNERVRHITTGMTERMTTSITIIETIFVGLPCRM